MNSNVILFEFKPIQKMENNNLDYKKSVEADSAEQTIMPTVGQNISDAVLKTETVIDKNGIEKDVDRTKIHDQNTDLVEVETNKNIISKPSEAAVDAGKRMVENQDLNSNIVANRKVDQ